MTSVCSSQPLDDVADMLSGGTPRKSRESYWNGSIPWLTPKDMGKWSGVTEAKVSPEAIGNGTRLAPVDTIFIAVRGMSLHNEIRVLRPAQAMTFNQDIKAIVAGHDIDPCSLYYAILSKKPELLDAVELAGHGTGRLPTDRLKDLSIPRFGRLAENTIVELFAALDRRIDLNRRMNATLEAMARAIFKDWFVDFGPTRAKAEGCTPYLAPELWDLFPDSLDDEGKPVGWEVSPLGERIEILDSKRIPLSSRERKGRQGPYPYHGATGVMDHVDDFLFEGVHVLLGEDGSAVRPNGKPFTQYVWGRFWANNHAHVLRGKGISNEMLLCFFQQLDIAPYVTGAVQQKLNQKNLKSIPFPASGTDTSAAFERVVAPLYEQFRRNSEGSHTLAQIRDLLLPKLMSGEIRLRDAEAAVKAVA